MSDVPDQKPSDEWEHFATLEPVVFVLRLQRRPPGADTPEWPPSYASATVLIEEEGHARIAGFTSTECFTPDSYRAIDAALRKVGVHAKKWSRITPEGNKRFVVAAVRPAPNVEIVAKVRLPGFDVT